jgi:hypothetical protein
MDPASEDTDSLPTNLDINLRARPYANPPSLIFLNQHEFSFMTLWVLVEFHCWTPSYCSFNFTQLNTHSLNHRGKGKAWFGWLCSPLNIDQKWRRFESPHVTESSAICYQSNFSTLHPHMGKVQSMTKYWFLRISTFCVFIMHNLRYEA